MKDKVTAGLLALFLGGLGVHQFYLGRGVRGIAYLIFCWTFIPVVISFFDGIVLLSMSEQAFNARYNYHGVVLPGNQIINHVHVGDETKNMSSTADELSKLNELKEKGIISDDEFKSQKLRILSQ